MTAITTLGTRKSSIAVNPAKSPAGGIITVTGPNVKDVVSITRVSSVATATITAHGWRTNDSVVFSGADQSEYNGTKVVTQVDLDTVTFAVTGTPATPATGALKATKTVTREVSSLTVSGETGTFTVNAHGFANSATITVAGSTPASYNGSRVITVTGGNAFTVDYTAEVDTRAEVQTLVDTCLTSVTHGWSVFDAAASANAKVYTRNVLGTAVAGYQKATFSVAKTGGSATGLANDVPATAGYQFVNVGGAKTGGSATGLANTIPATTGYQVVNVGGAKVAGDATGLANTVPATAGYQIVNVGGAKAPGDATGLTNDGTAYTALITVDGVGMPISVTGSTAQTYTTLLAEINTDLGASAVAALDGGNIKVTSATTGAASSVAITDTDLFLTLTGYVAVVAAVAGTIATDTTYTASISVDAGAHVRAVSIVGSAAQTYGTLIDELNTDSGAWYVASLDAGNIKVTSTITGATSDIVITDTNVFNSLTGYVAVVVGVPGVDPIDTTYTASISVDGVGKPISVVGSAAQTFTTLLAEINTDLGASAVATLNGGNIKVTSATTGAASTVATTDTDLFGTLTGYVEVRPAVPGVATGVTTYTSTFTIDGVAKPISIGGGTAQTWTTLLAEINTDLGASALATLDVGNLKVTSATTGVASKVRMVTGTLFPALTNFTLISAAVDGNISGQVPTADYLTVQLGLGALVGDKTGLANDATAYTVTITVDGVGKSVSVLGNAAQTYTTLISEINTDLAAAAVVTFANSGLVITSATAGATSSITVSSDLLFKYLSNYTGIALAVPTDTDNYVKVDFNTTGKIKVNCYGDWNAGTHAGTGEIVRNRQQINIGDRPGKFFVYTYPSTNKPLAIFR